MTQHYEFVPGDTAVVPGHGLHTLKRIRALVAMPIHGVKPGDLGGYIESEQNLQWDAWVADNAHVYGAARVRGFALISGNAHIFGNARVVGHAQVHGNARVHGDAWIKDTARVHGNALIGGEAFIAGDADVSGKTFVPGNATVSGHARIQSTRDLVIAGPAQSSGLMTTAFRDNVVGVRVRCGCFDGTLDQFRAAIEETHRNDPAYLAQYRAIHAFIQASFPTA